MTTSRKCFLTTSHSMEPFPQWKAMNTPNCSDKPHFSSQLGTYADKLWLLYPRTPANTTTQTNKWNRLPLKNNHHNTSHILVFDTDEYSALSKSNPKCTPQGDPKLKSNSPNSAPTVSTTVQEICDHIIKDMTDDITKLINTEIKHLCSKITSNLASLKINLQHNLNSQITFKDHSDPQSMIHWSDELSTLNYNSNACLQEIQGAGH